MKNPLSQYFLSDYLSVRDDQTNFPPDEFPDLFDRYEKLFQSALNALKLSKESLRSKAEFNFDSGDVANFESAVGVLRTVETLRLMSFADITVLNPPGADIFSKKTVSASVVR
jgi:hypothetical protein